MRNFCYFIRLAFGEEQRSHKCFIGKRPSSYPAYGSNIWNRLCTVPCVTTESKIVELFNLTNLPIEVYPKEINRNMHIAVKLSVKL